MASLAKLLISVGADIAGFETDMNRLSRNQKKRADAMVRDAKKFGIAFGAAFAAAAGAMGVIIKKTVDVADKMRDLSQATGISTEALSGYAYAAEQSGSSLEDFTNGVRKMQKSILDASNGMETQSEAFHRLGLSASDLINLSPEKAFELIADRLSQVENATVKAATAQEIFGRGASKLLPLMNEGAAGIAAMHQEAAKFGRIIGTDFANNADVFNDNIGRLRAQLEGVAIQIVSSIVPAMSEWLDKLISSGSLMRAAESIGNGLIAMFKGMAKALEVLTEHATATVAALGAFATIKAMPAFFAAAHPLITLTAAAVVGLAAAFIYFRSEAQQTQRILADLEESINDTSAAWVNAATVTDLIGRQVQIRRQWIETDQKLMEVQERLAKLIADAPDDLEQYHAEIIQLREEEARLIATQGEATDALVAIRKRMAELGKETGNTTDSFQSFSGVLDEVAVKAKKIEKDWIGYIKIAIDKKQDRVNKIWADSVQILDELINELERSDQAFEQLTDSLFPMEAATRRFVDDLTLLREKAEAAGWGADQLTEAEIRLGKQFADTTRQIAGQKDGLDLLSVAMDEAARILERTFSSIFDGIVNDSLDAWGAIEDGFKSLVTTIAQNPIRVVVADIQKAFAPGGGGFADLDLTKMGRGIVEALGSIFGLGSADSIFGQVGSSLGQIFGKSIFTSLGSQFFPGLLSALGTWAGPIGTALGAILGSALGDLVGGLFERDLRFTLGGTGAGSGAQRLKSPLADVVGISGQGGFGDLNDPSTLGGQLGKAIVEFDTQMAKILKEVTTSSQFDAIKKSLETWVGSWGEGADAADVLASRFSVILSNFDADFQAFVRGAADFEGQIERFGVALSADKLLRENPDIFSGRTTGNILALVSAFQDGADTMTDAFNEFLSILNRVVGIRKSLQDYAASDLLNDFSALNIDLSLADALAKVNSELMDAVVNFDGSVESFEQIGILAMAAREGELKLLAEIDAIQKGLNANLDKLKNDILGVTSGDASGAELFNQAQDLIGKITANSTAGDIAGIERQFDSIIRSIAPEDQAFMQAEIVGLIELFRARANEVLGMRSQETLDNAANMRSLIDDFIVRVGDPLDIIAASLDGQDISETMADGLDDINSSVASIGPQVANAIAQGLSSVTINVTVADAGLVTQ